MDSSLNLFTLTYKHSLYSKTKQLKHINKCKVQGLILAIALMLILPVNADSFSAKNTGQGFTAITHDFASSLSNPALLTQYDSTDDIFLSFNLGGMGSDQFDVIDHAENIANNLKSLANDINQQKISNDNLQMQVNEVINGLKSIDNKVVNIRNGINFQLIIPTTLFTFGLFTNQYGRIGGLTHYNNNDKKLLEDAIVQQNLNLDNLQSTANGIGYSVAEAGVILGYQAIDNVNYEMSFGSKIKYQRIDLFYNQLNISDFDDNEFELDNDKYLTKQSDVNIDLGLYLAWGEKRQWRAALVSNNLINQEVQHQKQSLIFKLEATTAIGFSYHNDWLAISTELDLTDREHFIALKPSKYASVGAEFSFTENAKFRLGLRSDLNDVDGDLYSLGLGFSPWNILTIDVAAFTGNNETIGAAIQFGFKV